MYNSALGSMKVLCILSYKVAALLLTSVLLHVAVDSCKLKYSN
jgi:hypothetical protein